MRSASLLRVLRSTAAVGAVALGSSAANAACTTANGVVTCTGLSTSDEVVAAYGLTPPRSVSLVIAEGATVVRGANQSIAPNSFNFDAAIGYTNIGTVGTQAANVDYNYSGRIDLATNTFTLDNRGVHNGLIFAFNVGGPIVGTNSGVVTRGIDLRGAGSITFTNSGDVFNTSFGGANGVILISSRTSNATGADGISRTTEAGGAITATIGGRIGTPMTATTAFQPQSVFTRSVGGVDLALNGAMGAVSADARGNESASQFTSVGGATTTTQTQVSDNRTIGANARIVVGAAGQVGNIGVFSGPGTATVIVDGAVGTATSFGSVNASAFGSNSTFRRTDVFANAAPFSSEASQANTNTNIGGAALVDVTATGRVSGSINASSNAGSATARVAGQVGGPSTGGGVSASSLGTNSTFQSASIDRGDGTFGNNSSSTQAVSGGAALASVATTGQVFGNVQAQGNGSATIDNAGRVRSSAFSTSNTFLTTVQTGLADRTIATDAAGVRTQVDRNNSSSTQQSLGGTATVTNRVDGVIDGVVQANGLGGASLDNAGAIAGGAVLSSVGTRTDGATSDQTTTTTTPVMGGGATTTSARDVTNMSMTRATGGAATADIAATGRVGGNVEARSNAGPATVRIAGQVGSATSFGSVNANSTGTNGTSQSRQITRSDGTSENSNSSTQGVSGGAALATVAATGQVFGSVSAQGNGSATVDNAGRIRGGAFATSNTLLTTAQAGLNDRTIATNAAGVRTQVDRNNSSFTQQSLGGSATVTNRADAVIDGTVQANGLTGAVLDNAGAIGGSVFLSSNGTRSDIVNTDQTTTVSTPATTGGATTSFARDTSTTTTARAIGGAATGTYGGTVGAAPPANGFASVNQNGTTASTATVTGTIFGTFAGTAGAENRDTANTTSTRQLTQPSGASTREQSNTNRDVFTQVASTSSLTVAATGGVLASGNGGGAARVQSNGGNATLTLDGGRIDGTADIVGGAGTNRTQASDTVSTFTRAAPVAGAPFPAEVQQSQVFNSSFEQRAATGTAIARVNSGTIGGDLNATGSGAGAGSLGADVTMNGTLTGSLTARGGILDTLNTTNDVQTRTGPAAVARTITSRFSNPAATTRGGVLVNVGGTVGESVFAGANVGDVTINLTGRANTAAADGLGTQSFSIPQLTETVETSTAATFGGARTITGRTQTFNNTLVGGTATINIAANAATRTANASSTEGTLFAQGLAGSTINIAAGSRVNQVAGQVLAGADFTNGTGTTTSTFTNGVQTGSNGTSTSVAIGGPATVNNAGIIGSAANLVTVTAAGIGGANVVNSGTINGSITALSRTPNRVTTTATTDFSDPVARRTVTTNVLTSVGGAAQINNSGLVTGGVTAVAANGTVTNSGVIRGVATLGGGVSNFTTTVTTTQVAATDTTPAGQLVVSAPSVANAALFTQNYTLNQNGLLIGGVATTGMTMVDPSGATVRTSNVNAAINLNNGSITLGDITGGANTATNVTLSGTGFLGVAANDVTRPAVPGQIVTGFQPTPALARFSAIDPTLGTTTAIPSGSRVSGVQTLTKAGDGAFVIVGAPFLAATGAGATATPANYTLDVGTLRVSGGELQLGLAGTTAAANSFGIRGNVENNAGLVIGRRITDGAQTAVQGINVNVLGNVVNGAAGSLIVGVNPSFVRTNAVGAGGPFSTAPTFAAFGPGSPGLASTNSFVRVDGNLNLAGNVTVQGQPNGIYEAGRAYDLFSVSGTYANTGTVRSNFTSPFVTFTLTPRSEGGRTVVALGVTRTNFDTVTTDDNAAAAAGALQANLPLIFAGIRNGTADGQDLASIVSALDSRLDAAQAQQLFSELSSGEFYGSLSAISTTTPFGDATDGLPVTEGNPGVGLWFRPTGQFATFEANDASGASEFKASNYGGSIGLNFNTGGGGHIGVAGGYGKLDVDTLTTEEAEADTYMVGFYAVQQIAGLHLSAQAVYGKTEWDVVRTLPLLGRTARSNFDSEEVRANLRIAYTIAPLPGFDLSPFAKVEARRYDFDAITETGAGAVSLTVGRRAKTVVSPEVGVRMSGALGSVLRPFAEGSYIFQGDIGSDRRMAFVGGRATDFTTIGVDPGDAIKGAIGVAADVGGGTVFVRGDYASGGRQQVGSVRGGLLFSF